MDNTDKVVAAIKAYLRENDISITEAAARLGVSQQAVSNQLSGRKFGANVARNWADSFGFNASFLMTGEGTLQGGSITPPADTVPIVPYAVRGGALQGFSEGVEEWECERITSPVRGAELAFEVTGDSMAPGFPAGTRVLLKKVKSVIAWGEVHVIDTVDGPVLKRIDQGGTDGVFILRSDNPAYQPIVVSREEIRGVWRVLLRMIQ